MKLSVNKQLLKLNMSESYSSIQTQTHHHMTRLIHPQSNQVLVNDSGNSLDN